MPISLHLLHRYASSSSVLLSFQTLGLACSGKTSILFHFAHAKAAAGSKVVYVCKRAKVEQVPPLLPQGGNAADPAYSKIQMRLALSIGASSQYRGSAFLLGRPSFAKELACIQYTFNTTIHCNRYLNTMAELRRYAACFHLLDDPPQTLIVDDISDFLDSRRAPGYFFCAQAVFPDRMPQPCLIPKSGLVYVLRLLS